MILSQLHKRLQKIASRKPILILFALAHSILLLMMTVTFPRINRKMGRKAFDLQTFGYSYEDAVTMLENLDRSTSDLYIFPQLLLLDVLYPLLLALFLSTLIIKLMTLLKIPYRSWYSSLYLLPFLAMCFDYFENILILTMLTHPSNVSPKMVLISSSATLLKSIFTTLSWILILILSVQWIISKRTK